MKLNVAQLMKSVVGATREYDVEESVSEVEDQRLTKPVSVHLHLTRINDGLLARGEVHTAVEVTCSRCLETASVPIAFQFDERFVPTIDIVSGQTTKDADVDPAEPVYRVDANHQIDVDELVRQGVVIEAPMHPLCGPRCQGLCPNCGANRNQGACRCGGDQPTGSMATLLKDLQPLIQER